MAAPPRASPCVAAVDLEICRLLCILCVRCARLDHLPTLTAEFPRHRSAHGLGNRCCSRLSASDPSTSQRLSKRLRWVRQAGSSRWEVRSWISRISPEHGRATGLGREVVLRGANPVRRIGSGPADHPTSSLERSVLGNSMADQASGRPSHDRHPIEIPLSCPSRYSQRFELDRKRCLHRVTPEARRNVVHPQELGHRSAPRSSLVFGPRLGDRMRRQQEVHRLESVTDSGHSLVVEEDYESDWNLPVG